MTATATGSKKEIPGNFFSLYGCSSPPTNMLLLYEKIQEWQGERHMDMLPNNSEAQFRSEDGPETVPTRSHSHHGLEAEAL